MAAVIKRETPTQTRPFSLADVQARADQILRDAAARADEIIRQAHLDAHDQLAAARRDAVAIGLDQGRKAGFDAALDQARHAALDEARGRLDALAHALDSALSDFLSRKSSLLASAESGVVEIALAIAARVCRSLSFDPSVAADNIRRVVAMIGHEHDADIHLHPDDFASLEQCIPSLLSDAARSGHVSFRPDAAVSRGGCLLRSRHGTIDASIHEQLDRIALAILGDYASALPPAHGLTPSPGATPYNAAPSSFISDATSRFVAHHHPSDVLPPDAGANDGSPHAAPSIEIDIQPSSDLPSAVDALAIQPNGPAT